MPPEPLPWDRKDFFKERKHERSSESLGSVARWKDSSHHGTREFNRWGSADFRRPPGHAKQGGWHLFSEDSGHGYVPSRSGDKMLEDDSCRPSILRGDGKYGRSIRENRFSQRDWKGHSWETSNGSPITSGKLLDVSNNDLRSVDDTITCLSHPNSDFVNTWDQLQLKDQHDKMGAVSGLGTGQRCDAENSVSSTVWKPLKWSRSGSLSSRGSGFSHSSSSKSMGGTDSNDTKADIQLKNSTPVQSLSGDAAACVTSAALSEETTSKKKPRLGWGEGLAKYEKKKVEGPDVTVNKDGAVVSACNAEPTQSFISNMADKSPRVAGFSDCASPATPSSVACSSSPGVEEKSFGKAMNIDNDISNLCVSPSPGSIYLPEGFPFSLEKLDMNLIANLGSSLVELLQSDDSSAVDSSFVRSTAMNKLLVCKGEVSKALEVTESEIDLLENELKLLKSETEIGEPCPAGSSSLPMEKNATPCKGQDGVSNLFPRPEQLQTSSENTIMEKMPLCNGALEDIDAAIKDEDMDSPGTATSKFVEPLSLVKADSLSDKLEHGDSSGNLDEIQIESENMVVKYSVPGSVGEKTGTPVSSEVRHTDQEDRLCDSILASNRECANRACGVFSKLLPRDQHVTDVSRTVHFLSCQSSALMKEKFAMRKQFLRFKERVLTIKFKVFQHLWNEDARLLSVRKQRPKSQKIFDLSLRTALNGNQKHRSSIRSRCSSPAGNLSLVPTTEMINFTSKLLSDSQVKIYRNTLKMPSLILDKNEKMVSRFISSNGLVEDPCAVEKERAVINPWMPIEREIFMKKLSIIGKDFRKIASFLDHKTTADCVEFYYKNHKSDCFEKSKKQDCSKQMKAFFTDTYMVTSEKKRIREINAASLKKFGKSSIMVACADDHVRSQHSSAGRLFLGGYGDSKPSWDDDGILDRSNSLGFIGNESDTVIADALTGMCGSLSSEAMSSCITSCVDPGESNREWKCQKVDSLIKRPLTPDVMQNVDDETCSDESCGEMDPSEWTDEEKSMFIQAVSSYGKDFVMISRCVRTRSRDQCKVFFSKARKCLGLDLIHPGPRNVGTPVTDDANGGGSDAEDACVVEAVETGSVICGNKLGCKLDEDLPLITMNKNDDESDPAKIVNFESDRNRSEENNGMGHMDYEDFEAVETSVSDACQAENIPELIVHGDSNIMNSVEKHSDSVHTRRSTVVLAATETGGDQVIEQSTSILEMASVREGIKPVSSSPEALMENKGLASVGFENELSGQELLLPKCSLIRTHEKCGPSGLQSSVQDSNTIGNCSHPAAESSCSGLHLNPEYQHKVSLELDSMEKPYVISLPLQNSPPTATSPSQDTASILCDKTLNQDRLSSTLDFRGNVPKQSPKSISRDDFHQNLCSHSILSHDESSQILGGYPLQISNKKEMNGDVSSRKLSEVQTLSQSESNVSTRSVAQDCYLQKCNSSKPHSSVAELPRLSQKIEKTILHSRAHSRSLSDTDKPCRNGDVKLFGQILSHPSSTQKSNSNTHENEEKGIHNSNLSSKLSNLKFSGYHDVDGNSSLLKFDRNNYLGLENVAMRSYGFWDGNRIQTGFSSLPDSAILLAKYPAAFGNYPTPSSKIEPLPLQTVVKSNERNLNGASGFPREMSSSNGVVDCQLYRNREGSKVQPFTVDMKQRQDIFSEIQRRNGFEAVSSLQPQGRGMVGMNVVGRKVIVGGPCTVVSDPVAAIKMHYAKSDQYGGQTGSIIGEEESWRGKGDLGR